MAEYLKKMESVGDYNPQEAIIPGVTIFDDSDAVKYSTGFHEFDPKYLYSDLSTSTSYNRNKTAIGIEVIPESMTPNGKACYVSVKNMSWEDPEEGTVVSGNDDSNPGAKIPWGNFNDTVVGLPDYSSYPKSLKVVDDIPQEELNLATTSSNKGTRLVGDMEWDNYPAYAFDHREEYSWGGTDNFLPATTTHTGLKLNPMFLQQNTWTMDWDGKRNTKYIINRIKGDSWKTGSLSLVVGDDTLIDERNYPVAAACYRFNPASSNTAHQWYVPGMAELACLWENVWKINNKLSAISEQDAVLIGVGFDSTYPTNVYGDHIWSSTVSGSNNAWYLSLDRGTVDNQDRSYCGFGYRVRAFIQL